MFNILNRLSPTIHPVKSAPGYQASTKDILDLKDHLVHLERTVSSVASPLSIATLSSDQENSSSQSVIFLNVSIIIINFLYFILLID